MLFLRLLVGVCWLVIVVRIKSLTELKLVLICYVKTSVAAALITLIARKMLITKIGIRT